MRAPTRSAEPSLRDRWGGHPVVATDRLVAWTTSGLYTAGGLLALLPTLVLQPSEVHVVTLRWIAAAALLVGLLVLAVGRRLPRSFFHVLTVGGTALVTTAVMSTSGNELSVAYAGLYLLVALVGALFFAWRAAALHLAAVVLACVSALGPPTRGAAVLVAGTTVIVAVVVAWLVRAASAAEVDPLTGLLNRRGFDRVIESAVSRAERGGAPLALALLDLDHFKLVNDRGGHSRGDELLRATARALGEDRLPGQAVSRQGGDEFALLLPGTDAAGATALVEQLRERLVPGGGFSAGVAAWEPGDSVSMMCHRADMALYMSKRSGRGRTSSYSDATGADDPTELQDAVRAGEVVVHYQPVVDLHTGLLVGAEALARWHHPVRGAVPPAEFVPAAERSGAVHALGAAVLADACERAAAWLVDVPGFRSVSVNASPRELEHDDYVDGVQRLLARTGLPPDALVLEVTESALDEGAARITAALTRLRALGVRIAMDDFGTGYSSLSRLDSLPVDIIKIDRAFVSPIGPSTVESPIVAATVALAGALGLAVVVEGVETPHQADVLRRHGCSRAQGYLFSAAVPPARLPTALREGVVGAPQDRRPMAGSAALS